MTDILNLYRLMTWASPAFPIGAFSYSHGIEHAVEAGLVFDADSLKDWIRSIIIDGDGRSDAILFCHAYESLVSKDIDAIQEIIELASAMRASSEFAVESRQQGEAFFKVAISAWPNPDFEIVERLMNDTEASLAFPIAFAVACAVHRAPLKSSLAAYLHGYVSNLVSAGIRLIPLGQTDGQTVIASLESDVTLAVDTAMVTGLENLGSATPIIDWTSTQHETQYTRLFRS
ncbi:MAG: urease accessory protein UreF [SAR202 cluster bacterium]|jgi:urease accessory protein|nr:urease accessory protein UreF [SAR202 cluster bacterium]